MARVSTIPFALGEHEARCMRRFRDCRWAAGVAASCYGMRAGLRVADASILPALLDALPPCAHPVDAGDPVRTLYSVMAERSGTGWAAYVGPRPLARRATLDVVRAEIEAHLDTVLAVTTPDRAFLHAGVVARDGRALVLPGASFAGKSTLVGALLDRGFTYYTDDTAVLDGWGHVHPYPRPLSLRAPRSGAADAVRVHATRVGKAPIPISAVVLTRFDHAATFAPARVSPGRAALTLLQHALSARTNPTLTLRVLARVAGRARVFEGPRGEAAIAAAALENMLDEKEAA